jgi:tripartite-type tricarboxylate transporter receptor subunit TctC
MFESLPVIQEHIKAGRLRALAVTEARRSSGMPELPTLAEAGVPGYEFGGWHGVIVPRGTPPQIVAKLNADMNRVLNTPETRENFMLTGSRPGGGRPEEFARHIRSEREKWTSVITTANIRAD